VSPAQVVVGETQQNAAQRFSHFFEEAFVNRMSPRICVRMARFWRSTRRCRSGSEWGCRDWATSLKLRQPEIAVLASGFERCTLISYA